MIQVVHDADPYDRLTSIHNGRDALQPHQSAAHARQHPKRLGGRGSGPGGAVSRRVSQADRVRRDQVRRRHPAALGQLSAEEMVHRFWECIIAGTYPGHGECYLHPSDVLWWAKGGVLAARARRGSRSCATSWPRRRPRASNRSTSGRCRTSAASRANTTSCTSARSRPDSGSFNCRGANATIRTSWPAGCSSTSTCSTRGT